MAHAPVAEQQIPPTIPCLVSATETMQDKVTFAEEVTARPGQVEAMDHLIVTMEEEAWMNFMDVEFTQAL